LQRRLDVLVKKYGNRRLYDTARSRYITLEDLAKLVRNGEDVRVVDAKSGDDLTNATLAQIIIEGRGAARLLPVPLLVQLIRLGDNALAEFLGQYVTWALEIYVQAQQGTRALTQPGPANPLHTAMTMFTPFERSEAQKSSTNSELSMLRREIEELKKTLKKRR
jgi:polyhydroxyalkanoate synthesis repressor PhaR